MTTRNVVLGASLACAAALTMLLALGIAAPGGEMPSSVRLGPESSLWLEGKSNVHDFESRTTTVAVRIGRDSSVAAPVTSADLATLVHGGLNAMDVEVPVTSLHSGKAGLDKNLWQDLRAQAHPAIRFHLTRYAAANGTAGDTTLMTLDGTLSIAGVERPVTLAARAYRSDGGLRIDGSHSLRMTEFGIKPRTMMLGTLRVQDGVIVHYRLLLLPRKA